jgi:hypothetical protein
MSNSYLCIWMWLIQESYHMGGLDMHNLACLLSIKFTTNLQ